MKRLNISSFFMLLLLSCSQGIGQSLADSLISVLPEKQGSERLQVLSDLTWEFLFSNVSKAEAYAAEQFTLANAIKDSAAIAMASNDLAAVRFAQSKLDEALQLNKRALKIRKQLGNTKGIGSSYNKITNIFIDQTKLDSAIYYGLESLKLFEGLKDSASIGISLNVLSNLYIKERDFGQAERYARQAYSIAESLDNKYGMMGAAGNISAALQEQQKIDEAIIWNERCLLMAREMDHKTSISSATSNLGYIYRLKGDLTSALKYYQEAIVIARESQDRHGVAHMSNNIGGIYNDIGNSEMADDYFEEAYQIAYSENLGRVRLVALDGLAEASHRIGDESKAFIYLTHLVSLKDSLYNEEKAMQMQELQTKYDTEKKEQENKILAQEKDIAELEGIKTKSLLYTSVGFFLLLSLVGFFYFAARKRKMEAAAKDELLKERERGIEAVFAATEDERKRIAKDLHDGVGQQLSGLRMSFESLSIEVKSSQPDKASAIERLSSILDEACKEVRNISHQMMPKALSESGLVAAIDDMLHKSFSLTDIRYRFEHFKVDAERFNEKVELGLFRVSQELVNNIMKHSSASEVVVQLFKSKNNLVLIVEDNGKGFVTSAKKDGIGLTNITSRMNTVDGEVTWEPGPQQGTVATVRVPV
ncbi:MAG: tetratricopeptide repeat protein [Flavobacteriales bacterium]